MAAYLKIATGAVKHVSEGSWQHDYMADVEANGGQWRPATDAEVSAAAGVYVPPEPEPSPVKAKAKPKG